ncbi:MAG: exodeoxyribonuclease VII small subunit [Clostridia bacterium]|nr:exodeoxyribonuclease VII small subunit [Clostridia bacterium]
MEEKKITFEQALTRLEQIVRDMESGDAPLDMSLSLFEEGVKLVKFCTSELDRAEQKVKILREGQTGEMTAEPFTPKADG